MPPVPQPPQPLSVSSLENELDSPSSLFYPVSHQHEWNGRLFGGLLPRAWRMLHRARLSSGRRKWHGKGEGGKTPPASPASSASSASPASPPSVSTDFALAWMEERRQVSQLVDAVRTHGRSYESGAAILTFGEVRALYELRQLDVPAVLLRARAAGLMQFESESWGEGSGGEGTPLAAEEDDEVVITALQPGQDHARWQRGLTTRRAPIAELDNGLLKCVRARAC